MIAALQAIAKVRAGGYVTRCSGHLVSAAGLGGRAGVGDTCLIERRASASASPLFDDRAAMAAEVVGFSDAGVQLVPYDEPRGITHGARVALAGLGEVRPSLAWRGRVLDAMGCAIDGGPPLPRGTAIPILACGIAAAEAAGWGHGRRWEFARSTCSPPAANVSAWASSRARASASRPCWR